MNLIKIFVKFLIRKYKAIIDRRLKKNAIQTVKNSGFFDENYYRRTYNIPQNIDAAEHYLTKGYLCDYNPSQNFDTSYYRNYYKLQTESYNINPLFLPPPTYKQTDNFPKECVNIKKEFNITPTDKKRCAIFSSFSSDGIVHDYVIFYLKGLLEVVDNIIFVADNPLLETELKKLENLVCYCEFERHNEYDFGSYKRGYEYAKKKGLLENIEDLIFCNESCVGPIYPFKECFEQAEPIKCDFWGFTASDFPDYHIQSYFMVFRKTVIKSNILTTFLSLVKKQTSVEGVIFYYESKFTPFLELNGFQSYALFKNYGINYGRTKENFSFLHPQKSLRTYTMPLIKKKALLLNSGYGNSQKDIKKIIRFIKKLQPNLNLDF